MHCRKISVFSQVAVLALCGCAAVQTAVAKRNLDVQSKMSDTIFLDPVSPSQQTIYVQVRNTSDRADFDISSDIRNAVEGRGYRVMDDANRAHYILQVNVLQVGKIDPAAADKLFAGGYGSAIGAGAYAAAAAGLATHSLMGAGIAGLALAPIALVADAAVKDVHYSVITDVQISERSKVAVTDRTNQRLTQGRSGTRDVTSTESSNYKRYQTRVMSMANKVNLEFEEALPPLRNGIVHSIAGIF
jgi:hypothetical protein